MPSRARAPNEMAALVVVALSLVVPVATSRASGKAKSSAASSSASVSAAVSAEISAETAAHVRDLYRRSKLAYDDGHFQEAAELLVEAYRLEPVPVFLFNLARAYEGLGEFEKAIDAYERYLTEDPASSDRKSVEARVAALRKTLEERAALQKQRDEERQRAEEASKLAAAREATMISDERRPSALPWVVAGVGVLGVGAGVVLGVVARNKYHDAVDEPYAQRAQQTYSTAQSFATAANVAFIAGGVIGAAGVVWGVLDLRAARASHDAHAPSASVAVGFGTLAVVGEF